jgi:hypothetical protein
MSQSTSPLFVVGCDRSGTTLLRLMITNHPQFHILHETDFLRTLRDRSESYGDFTEPRQRWYFIRDLQLHQPTSETHTFAAFDLADHEAERALAEAAPVSFAGAAAALFRASAEKHDAPRWGDKTPKHVFDLSWLADAFPDAQFLHIIRDGRDVAASFRKAGWEKDLRKGARKWRTRVHAARDAGKALPPARYREVYYEALVRSPEETLRDLCDWLGVSYTPSMLHFHRDSASHLPDAHDELYEETHNPVDASRAQAWTSSLTAREVADVEETAGEALRTFGYELEGARIPLWLRGLRFVHQRTLPYTRKLVDKLRRLGVA